MARRKKQTQQPIKTTSAVGYQGTIKLSVQKNGKTLKSQTFHNTGDAKLFEFLGNCLAGTFDANNRPCRIRLFAKDTATGVENTDSPDTPARPHWCDDCGVSAYVLAHEAAYARVAEGGLVTYYFRIPCVYLDSNKAKFCKLGLFPNAFTANPAESLSAHYLFVNDDKTEYVEQDLEEYAGKNYVLLIEWTLALINMQTAVATAAVE